MKTLFDNKQCRLKEELVTKQLLSAHMDFVINTITEATNNNKVNHRGANKTPIKKLKYSPGETHKRQEASY